jgi:hypothetical protein
MGSSSEKFAAGTRALMVILKRKVFNGFETKLMNVRESHEQSFGTSIKPNIPVLLLGDRSTLSFCVTETIWPK